MAGAGAADVSEAVAEDGSSLKVSAPVAQSPIGDVDVETLTPTLTVSSAEAMYVSGLSFTHEFQVHRVEANGGLTMVDTKMVPQGGATTSYTVETLLDNDTPYRWQARAVFQSAVGPWSSAAGFVQRTKATL